MPILKELYEIITHLQGYWLQKKKKDSKTLFNLNEPSIDKVGYLIKLSCGHNGKLSDIELGLLRMQLEKAGFTREIP